jgi:hypothetical protein
MVNRSALPRFEALREQFFRLFTVMASVQTLLKRHEWKLT